MSDENSKKRLGRGLAALMGDLDKPLPSGGGTSDNAGSSPSGKDEPAEIVRGERIVPIEKIRANPNNPRRHFSDSDLQELTDSIREHGIVQPILVRPVRGEDLGGAEYEIIAGERRWRSAQRAALHSVPIVIREVGDKQALELAIIENVQRADLNSLEEAQGYQQLIDEYDYSQNDLAQVIGKSRSHVANTLRLLKLPPSVQKLVSNGELSAGHARTLVTADDPEGLARRILAEGLSVRQAEALAQNPSEQAGKPVAGSRKTEKSADIRSFEQRIEEALGLKIDLRHKDSGKGELRIQYKSLEQLDELERRLGKSL
ncbi:MAG: ParB/RepB/Spo0J family partition protein [Rhizobiaceae bacterium]|jgi:ParB family chromosome partitioning protein|nr:ParB/RepB/Spo0J family partition protein [Rhizobiaceae bacterium]